MDVRSLPDRLRQSNESNQDVQEEQCRIQEMDILLNQQDLASVLQNIILNIEGGYMQKRTNQVSNIDSPVNSLKQSQVFDDTLPVVLKNGFRQPFSKQQDGFITDNIEKEVKSSRSEQHIVIYFLNLVLSFCISFQNIFFVFTNDDLQKGYMSITMAFSTIIITLTTTWLLCKDKWKIFNLYVLLDNIFLTQVASSFGFVGFLLVIYEGEWYQLVALISFPLEILFFVGNFRILMLYVNWSKWRIILFKLVLLADSAVFFQIGAYYMSSDFQYTKGQDFELDSKIKDFVLLYIFGLFALFVQLYTKMCDIDQTAQLKFVYQFKEMEEQVKIERIRKSVMSITRKLDQGQNVKSRFRKDRRISYLEVQDLVKE